MTDSDILARLGAMRIDSAGLDAGLAAPDAPPLTLLFLWGFNCPNCDIAKQAMALRPARFLWPDVRWLHCNVYEDAPMAPRFGLHGIPVFLLFARGRTRPLGRITGWPGAEAFVEAIESRRAA